ncbi:MAG: UDP-2,3-diacylglucosamine diphosphatase LpxI [Pseudomonadota bacterium]
MSASRTDDLPKTAGGTARVALIAGSGALPVMVADALAEAGRDPFVVAIEGEASDALKRHDHVEAYSGHPGVVLRALKASGAQEVVMIGGIRGRPDLRRIRPDFTTIRFAARLLPRLGAGDDALLRAVIDMVEDAGLTVRGVHQVLPELLAGKGHLAGPVKTSRDDDAALQTAVRAALALGAIDAGQGAVAVKRRVVALEGAEGTDLMLERVAKLRRVGRLSEKPGGVLVKLAKPGQELRADLPTIGPQTVQHTAAAGLTCIGVHAGHSLIASLDDTIAAADAAKISLIGIVPEDYGATHG